MKITLLQQNYTVGDLDGNASKIVEGFRTAHAAGAALAVFPELALLGYPPRDLLLNPGFIEAAWERLEKIAHETRSFPPGIVGIAKRNASATSGRPLFNSAAYLQGGEVRQVYHKNLLPSYDVFDEDRYFEPGDRPETISIGDGRLGITICEDVWSDKLFWRSPRYHRDPIETLASLNIGAIINISASPFSIGKQHVRERMLSNTARRYSVPIVYVNQAGGNDDLVFDGRSLVVNARGEIVRRAASFAEDAITIDLEHMMSSGVPPEESTESDVWNALVLGTKDYVRKCGFRRVILGLSGGIDSALTATVAVEALGPENVEGVLMPSPYSSEGSVEDSLDLARRIGIRTRTIPIAGVMDAYSATIGEHLQNHDGDLTLENLQARIRGNLLMALSNNSGALLLTTGNKSELSVGYSTIYGDMSGGLGVLSDVPKTLVYRVARWLPSHTRWEIPRAIIEKEPSAELRADQRDSDSLPPYEILDEILARYIVEHASARSIVDAGFDASTVHRVIGLVHRAEFKRKQAAPGIKIADRAFGTGWRMPIALHWQGFLDNNSK